MIGDFHAGPTKAEQLMLSAYDSMLSMLLRDKREATRLAEETVELWNAAIRAPKQQTRVVVKETLKKKRK